MANIREWPKYKLPSVEILQLLANFRYEVRVLRKLTFEFSYRLEWTRVCWGSNRGNGGHSTTGYKIHRNWTSLLGDRVDLQKQRAARPEP
jgi:hypothetical protein